MLDAIRSFGQIGAVLLLGISIGAAWMMTIVSANVSYDRLEPGAADGHVRQMLKSGSSPIGFLLLAATALAILGGAYVAGGTALLAAFGFFTNHWTLRGFKRGETPPGVRRKRKRQRVVAVSFTLIFTLAAVAAAALALLGV